MAKRFDGAPAAAVCRRGGRLSNGSVSQWPAGTSNPIWSNPSRWAQMAAMKRYTEEQCRKVVRDFEASGLGLLAFCRDRGICTGSLAAWRKRYRRCHRKVGLQASHRLRRYHIFIHWPREPTGGAIDRLRYKRTRSLLLIVKASLTPKGTRIAGNIFHSTNFATGLRIMKNIHQSASAYCQCVSTLRRHCRRNVRKN
jgi:hypothetical protein